MDIVAQDPILIAQEAILRGASTEVRRILADRDDVRALVLLGVADLREGLTAEAMERFERAVEVAPDDAIARAYHALTSVILGKVAQSKESLDRATALGPDLFIVRLVEAQCAYRLGFYVDALKAVRRALAAGAPDPGSYALALNLQRQAQERSAGNFVRSGSLPRLATFTRRLRLPRLLWQAARLSPREGG